MRQHGFSLAELLIVLAMLGVVATLTIPKVLLSGDQDSSKYRAMAREVATMTAAAHTQYTMSIDITTATKFGDMTQYLNYVRRETNLSIDDIPGWPSFNCSGSSVRCLRLHNGGVLWYLHDESFAGTSANHGVRVGFDPDGKSSNYKAVQFWLYADGKIRSWVNAHPPNAISSYGTHVSPVPAADPTWFSWN